MRPSVVHDEQHDPDDAMPKRRGVLRLLLLMVLGAVLVWIILTRSLAASLAETSPETALALQPREPQALLSLARRDLNALLKAAEQAKEAEGDFAWPKATEGTDVVPPATPRKQQDEHVPSDRLSRLSRLAERGLLGGDHQTNDKYKLQLQSMSDPSANVGGSEAGADPRSAIDKPNPIRVLAQRAIAADPFNADALAILGQLAEIEGDEARTGPLMEVAARLSIRESYAVYWLLQRAQKADDNAAVLRFADTLLRTRGRSAPLVVPVLTELVEKDKVTADVTALLSANPPWRTAFLSRLTGSITDARTPLYLLLGLRKTAHPPTQREIAGYITFLINRKFHELAYYTWLQFLPRDELATLSPLYNPSFELAPSGLPFDWVLAQGSGVISEIRPRFDTSGEKALFVEFGLGRVEFPGVRQVTLLGPGTYELKGKYKGSLIGPRSLIWRVTCAGSTLIRSDLLRGDPRTWREFTLSFTVPPTGCRAQEVRLDLDARSASERLVTGSMWFDDLELRRGG